jgi:hypothetical protein
MAEAFFPNGERLRVTYGSGEAEASGRARLEIGEKRVVLEGVVDDAETTEQPRVFVVTGEPVDVMLLLGGRNLYRVDTRGRTETLAALARDTFNTEFWSLRLLAVESGVVVVYEGGVLLIDRLLQPRWHVQKYYNDFLHKVEQGRLWFLEDHERPWSIDLTSGLKSNGSP